MIASSVVRWMLPIAFLGVFFLGGWLVTSSKAETPPNPNIIEAPLVKVTALDQSDHRVTITGYGELVPLEQTLLTAQVSGEVKSWHPNFVAGGIVKRGEVLFRIATDNYQAALLHAQAQVVSAKAALIEEQAKAIVAQKQAKKLTSKQVTALYLREPQVLSAEANLKSAQANLKQAQKDLDNCTVLAPFTSLIVSRDIGVGQYVTVGTPVAKLNNVETGEVHIPIAGFDQRYLPLKLTDIPATIEQQGYHSIVRQGKIVRDLGIVDSDTRMMSLVVQLSDPYGLTKNQGTIHFGSYVKVSFLGQELKDTYRLPQELVKSNTVWVMDEQQHLQPRHVDTLYQQDTYLWVKNTFKSDDKLVLSVPEYPEKDMLVKVISEPSPSTTVAQ